MHLEVLTEQTLYGHLLRHRADLIHLHFVQQANHQHIYVKKMGSILQISWSNQVSQSESFREFAMKESGEHGETSKAPLNRGVSKGLSVLDLILRFIAIIGTLASAIAMGTTNETLPFFTQFIRFKAQYSDLPTLT